MGSAINSQWGTVEQWSPTLFLVGGGLLVGHAAMSGIHAFTALSIPPDVFVTTGHLIALVGLVGLYPVVVDRTPIVARTAVVVAAAGLASWTVMTVTQFLAVAGVVASLDAVLPAPFFAVVLASTILTYGLFGIATLRVDDSSRTIGLLVSTPAVLTAVLVVDSVVTGVTALDGLVIGGGLAMSMLALGYRLRRWDRPTASAASTADVITG